MSQKIGIIRRIRKFVWTKIGSRKGVGLRSPWDLAGFFKSRGAEIIRMTTP